MDKRFYKKNSITKLSKFLGVRLGAVNDWKAGLKARQKGDVGKIRKFKLIMLGYNQLCDEVENGDYANVDEALNKLMQKHNVIYEMR